MIGHLRSVARGSISAVALSVILVTQAFAAEQAVGGDVPSDGSWAHYLVTRCTTVANRPFIRVTQPPDNGTLHVYVRNPNNNVRLGPIQSIHQSNGNWHQLGPLAIGQCFRISARKDGVPFVPGVVHWEGRLAW